MHSTDAASRRYAELDALRGIAVLMMIAYHALFDLSFFYGPKIFPGGLQPWAFAPPMIASLFLLLVGMSSEISWQRTVPAMRLVKSLRRAAIIFSGAMIITTVTWFVTPQAPILFGILHLIAVSAILLLPFHRIGKWNAIIGILVLSLGLLMRNVHALHLIFLPLGITPLFYTALDYYPIFPWFGVILIGSGLAYFFYIPERKPFLRVADIPYPAFLTWIGRHALLLYFLHQPLILLLISIFLRRSLL